MPTPPSMLSKNNQIRSYLKKTLVGVSQTVKKDNPVLTIVTSCCPHRSGHGIACPIPQRTTD